MKKKNFLNKLVFNKKTISNLKKNQMNVLNGGAEPAETSPASRCFCYSDPPPSCELCTWDCGY